MSQYELLAVREVSARGMYICLRPHIPLVITPGLVKEIRSVQNTLAENYISGSLSGHFYIIWFLENHKHLGCNGLDFNFILSCLKNHKEEDLMRYIDGVFNIMFLNHIGLGFPIINCSIVTQSLHGMSKEFFLLNRICFIKNIQSKGIKKFDIHNVVNGLLFQKELYEKNQYYHFDSMRLGGMRRTIEAVDFETPLADEIDGIREQFEGIKKELLKKIYQTASKNLKILERIARYDLRF